MHVGSLALLSPRGMTVREGGAESAARTQACADGAPRRSPYKEGERHGAQPPRSDRHLSPILSRREAGGISGPSIPRAWSIQPSRAS